MLNVGRAGRAAREDVDEALGPLHRQRLEQQRVDEGEERGVEADADRQRGDRHQREPRALAQPPERIADVGEEGFEQDDDYNSPHDSPRIFARYSFGRGYRVGWVLKRPIAAQVPGSAAGAFTLEQVLDYPFPDNLVASPIGSTIAWTFNERGVRNIYVAEAPGFRPRRLTPYQR